MYFGLFVNKVIFKIKKTLSSPLLSLSPPPLSLSLFSLPPLSLLLSLSLLSLSLSLSLSPLSLLSPLISLSPLSLSSLSLSSSLSHPLSLLSLSLLFSLSHTYLYFPVCLFTLLHLSVILELSLFHLCVLVLCNSPRCGFTLKYFYQIEIHVMDLTA